MNDKRTLAIIAMCATLSGCTLVGAATGAGIAAVHNSHYSTGAPQSTKRDSRISVGKSSLLGVAVGAALDVAIVYFSLRNGGVALGFQCVDSTSPRC